MKTLRNTLAFILILFTSTLNASALSCSNADSQDLGQIATYVKSSYEVIDNSETKEITVGESTTTYFVPNYSFEISIYNVTEDIYLSIKDDVFENTFTVYNYDTDNGTYTFTNDDFGTIYNYEISIMSAKSGCYGQKIKTIKLTKPAYNPYSEYTFCQNSSNLYCQKFITQSLGITSEDDFLSKINTNNEKNNPKNDIIEETKVIKELFKKNWKIYLIILAVVILLTSLIIVVIQKRKKNKGWRL